MEIQVLTWYKQKCCRRLSQLMDHNSPCLGDWISIGNTDKQAINLLPFKKTTHTIAKMRDNINMNSTIAESMYALG